MELTGGCLCGAVRFGTDVQPQWITHCHCIMCRKVSGAAFMTGLMYRAAAIQWSGAALVDHGLEFRIIYGKAQRRPGPLNQITFA